MKKNKILLLFLLVFITGCATSSRVNDIDKNIKKVDLDAKLMKKYQITNDSLIKFKDGYIFYYLSSKGTNIVFLDKNYNEIKKTLTPILLNAKKLIVKNDQIYLFGVDEKTYNPSLVIFSSKGKVLKIDEIKRKYALAKDLLIVNNDIYFIIDVYKDGKSYIEVYKNGKIYKKIKLENGINGNYLLSDGKDLILIGIIKNRTQDAFVMNLTKGWIRFFDLGMDDEIENPKIENEKIIFILHSTDNMGADEYYEIILNKNGNIIKNKAKIKFAPLPIRLRT